MNHSLKVNLVKSKQSQDLFQPISTRVQPTKTSDAHS